VLVESPLEGSNAFVGTSCRYAPVEVQCSDEQVGSFVDAVAGRSHAGRIVAQAAPLATG
jgi:hypothetical protein